MAAKQTECPHCGLEPLPCPFCGKPAVIHGQNAVECTDYLQCGAGVDGGHWCGEENGIPAEHWVIEHWNKRASEADIIAGLLEAAGAK